MDKIDLQHYNQSEKYVRAIKKQYQVLIEEISRLTALYDIDTEKPFAFDDYPALKKQVNDLLNFFAENTTAIIEVGKQKQWEMGTKKVMQYLPFADKNLLNYSDSNRMVSDRVWRLTDQYKGELEMALDLGISKGQGANSLAREIKQYLNNPDKLFRRVRDKHGNLVLSQKAKEYHPGQGVYRSSFKNAQRLARTETNIAYHTAIYNKYQEFDFIVGIEIRLSNNPKHCPFCSAMAGKYPKDFKFTGWHPNCRCTTIPILAKDMDNVQDEEIIKDLPPAMSKWLEDNEDKIKIAKSKSYFVRDNEKYVKENRIYLGVLSLMDKAKKSEKEIYNFSQKIATQLNGYVMPINLKSKQSILRKVKNELNGNVDEIKDAIRTTIILDTEKYQEILNNKNFFSIFTRVKIQTPDKFLGYSGILTNVKTQNGILAEIQFNTEKMIYAKEKQNDAIRIIGQQRWNAIKKEIGLEGGLGHKYYEEMRILDKQDPIQLKKWKDLEKKSIEYYSKFR